MAAGNKTEKHQEESGLLLMYIKLVERLDQMDKKLDIIIMKENEAAALLNQQTELLKKIQGETQSLIDKVNQLIIEVEKLTEQQEEVTPELEAAITGVKEQVAVVDALVEDIPTNGGGEGGGAAPKKDSPPDGMSSQVSHV